MARDAGGCCRLEIRNPVADQEAPGDLDRPGPHQVQQHAGRRLAPGGDTPIPLDDRFGMIRAEALVVNPGALCGELFPDVVPQATVVGLAVTAFADPGLVRNDEDVVSTTVQYPDRLRGTRDPLEPVDGPDLAVIPVDHAVAVEENGRPAAAGRHDGLGGSRGRRRTDVEGGSVEYVVILNDDMTVITSNWIEEMLMWFSRSGVVGVGGRLLFPNDTVQHAGVLLLGQGPSHVYYGAESSNYGLAGSAVLCRNYTAVTGACMMVRRADYLKVAGFDPFFRINYNDVDFCMRLGKLGRIVYTPYAELYHHEAVSKDEASPDELRAFNERWADVIGSDPFYNRNLSQSSAFNAVSRKVRSLATDYPDYEEPSHRDTKTEKARSAPNIV